VINQKKEEQPRGCGGSSCCHAWGRSRPNGCCQKAWTRAHRLDNMGNSRV